MSSLGITQLQMTWRFWPAARPLSRRIPRGLLAGVFAAWLLGGCGADTGPPVLALRGTTMGTSYSVQVVDPPPALDQTALAGDIEARLDRINALMSTYRPDSELSRFNAGESEDWFSVSPELVAVVLAAQGVSRASDGAFDVTVGPLVNLWGFGPSPTAEALPAGSEIQAALARVGWQHLRVRAQPPALNKARAGLEVDLSAIAKGYAVDQLAALLKSQGIADYLVEIGGELRARGLNGRGLPWQIAIERPEAGRRAVFRVVALRDQGMATSGDYRNFVEIDGVHYSHTIDPKTGRPVGHRLASVTVIAESTMRADAWATALLVLGPERGLALAERQGLAALFIEHADPGQPADGSANTQEGFRVHETPAFQALAP